MKQKYGESRLLLESKQASKQNEKQPQSRARNEIPPYRVALAAIETRMAGRNGNAVSLVWCWDGFCHNFRLSSSGGCGVVLLDSHGVFTVADSVRFVPCATKRNHERITISDQYKEKATICLIVLLK